MTKKKTTAVKPEAEDDGGTVEVRALVSFGVFVDGRPISVAGGGTVRLPVEIAASLVNAKQAEYVSD